MMLYKKFWTSSDEFATVRGFESFNGQEPPEY